MSILAIRAVEEGALQESCQDFDVGSTRGWRHYRRPVGTAGVDRCRGGWSGRVEHR